MAEEFFEIDLDNMSILRNPSINKGTAFTREERIQLGLLGLLPNVVSTIDEQIKRRMDNFDEQKEEFAKVLLLKDLRERNEILYFSMLKKYPEKLLPYVYTPMVGETAIKFSNYYTSPRGVFFSYPDRDQIEAIVNSIPKKDVQAIVITDGSRILGLGDMGAGGMAIPIGKLDLYTVFGGIDPDKVLPVTLDVGTNNPDLIQDPYYIGWKHARIEGKEYREFVDRVVKALKKRYPHVLLQWEDFKKELARPLLDQYKDEICSFNDDIQGTAASALVAMIAAMKVSGSDITKQKIAILGGGSAGTGIAELILYVLVSKGMTEEQAKKNLYIIDVNGLLQKNDPHLDDAQKVFAHDPNEVKGFDIDQDGKIGLQDVVVKAKITVLIGVSGQANIFTESMIKEMAKNTSHPVVMPLSNPTSKAEATPENLLNWTDGKALIATGSPFKPVEYKGKTHVISQCNNVYIFPGLGLGVIAARAKKVPVEFFIKAVEVVSNAAMKYQDGRLFPKIDELPVVSKEVGLEVAKLAIQMKLHQQGTLETIQSILDSISWTPKYKMFKRKKK
jgi:malate dehydrogenase (oxaloacetate-decarboxylating)